MDITIRKAGLNDWEIVQKLNNEVFEHDKEYDRYLDMQWSFSEAGIAHYKEAVSAPDFCTFIAFDGDIPVGHIVGSPNKISFRAVKTAEIRELGVSPAYRSKGIGSRLVDALREWCKGQGYQTLLVNAYCANEQAIAFYKKLGLVPIDIDLEMDI